MADPVLDEFRASGLDLTRLPGNSAKLRLLLDLVRILPSDGRLRVLDVGCAGPVPMNLWEPFVPLAKRLELVGVDVAYLDAVEARAAQLGVRIELHRASALELTDVFARESFDIVVSTQVLEHVREWRNALREMRDVAKRDATLLVTCDAGDRRIGAGLRARFAAKGAYHVIAQRATPVRRVGERLLSGDWERGPTEAELRDACAELDLTVERLARYCLLDAKVAQRHAGSLTRQLWLAFEEALAREADGNVDPTGYGILYLRARRGR